MATGVAADIDDLHKEHKIFIIHNPPDKDNLARDAVFPAEMLGVYVDEDIVTQVSWHAHGLVGMFPLY